jgi:Ca2+/H+ antiporter
MNWLLIFVPIAIGLEFLAPERYLLVFATSALAILPLAGWMGRATFPAGLVLMVLLSAIITAQVAGDGRSDWLKGLQLLAVYLIFGLAFFFLPSS